MKYLIINADDFGNYASVNKGIVEGIGRGVITSTSVMVYRKHAQGVDQLKPFPHISIGLHFELPKNESSDIVDEFNRQVDIFTQLVGRKPDHFDSHKIRPKNIKGLTDFLENYSNENHMPIRDWGHVNFIDSFFGLSLEGTGALDINRITSEALITTLNKNLREGYNELMCHAGHVDSEVMNSTSYNTPREIELNSLLSPEFRHYLEDHGDIKLISWKDVRL